MKNQSTVRYRTFQLRHPDKAPRRAGGAPGAARGPELRIKQTAALNESKHAEDKVSRCNYDTMSAKTTQEKEFIILNLRGKSPTLRLVRLAVVLRGAEEFSEALLHTHTYTGFSLTMHCLPTSLGNNLTPIQASNCCDTVTCEASSGVCSLLLSRPFQKLSPSCQLWSTRVGGNKA